MKTLLAAMFAVLTFAGVANALPPIGRPAQTPEQNPRQKITTAQLGEALEALGYTPERNRDKDGKVLGYYIDVKRGDTTVTMYLSVASNGMNLWIDVNMVTLDEKNPPTSELLLAFLGTHDQLWPAYLVYLPKTKMVQMAMSVSSAGFDSDALKAKLNTMMDKFLIVAEVYKKAKAEEQKAQRYKD
jgi:hypothetical protein